MKKHIIIWFLLLFNITLLCQGEGIIAVTTLQQSPKLLGAGQIGVSIPTDDVLGFYFNPAILGYSSRNNHLSVSFPLKTDWPKFGQFTPRFNNFGITLGYNLKSTNLDLPITIGMGYLNHKFEYNDQAITSNETTSYDQFNSISLGIGIDYYAKINLGMSLKSFESKQWNSFWESGHRHHSIDGIMFDFGALVLLPISDLLLNKVQFNINNSTSLSPRTNLSLGYSIANIGDEYSYVNDSAQEDPLSRTARLGYTIDLGLNLKCEGTSINLVNYSFSAEAQDILIRQDTSGFNYQGGIGDISISNNILNLKSDNNVIVHKGHIIKLLDTIIITSGRFSGHVYSKTRKTSGFGFSSKGIFTLLNKYSENSVLKYITKHFVIDYFDADVEFFESVDTNFGALSIHFRGFEI